MNSNYLERLKQQRDQINTRIQAAEAREKSAERKRDARRKILIGAYYLDMAQKEGQYEQLVQRMDEFLTRNSDRKLFDLPELTETDEQEAV
jgi:uncharacterized protein (DUF1919 family)